MYEQLFVNLTIITTCLFLYHQLFKKILYSYKHSLRAKITLGTLTGVLAILLMHFSIQINGETLIDLRHIPLMLATLFGGWVPTLITGIMIIIGRFFIGVNASAMANLIFIACLIPSFILIVKTINGLWKASITMMSVSVFFFSIIVYQLIGNAAFLNELVFIYLGFTFAAGIVSVYTNKYLRRTNQLMKEYERNAFQDPLTGLNNVRSFDQTFNRLSTKAIQKKEMLSLTVIDIDYFKRINDTYGHPEGDEILKQVGKILLEKSRESDFVSRNGGEEFTVLMPKCSEEEAKKVSERIRKSIQQHSFDIHNGHTKINLTVSIGISTYPGTVGDTRDLYRKADQALYIAKNEGRNRVASA
ncbi:GGDEF domain-containing protein [Halobacillus yeomjeoni]|uniref:Diguanylate cyclase n=1 Tax=Halobacillus yeomjeoni TaxID=311194 RepID=A0A931MUU4_9BACI|nr:diguanylate cyclase [Halobacillus yeomjeoni]MBH0229679.1 diguanylate cyclase [Halobacillus yeomjeoni]